MNKTFFSEVQRLFERTYAAVGINLEECLIDRARCSQLTKLAGVSARELSELARTFLRTSDDRLYVGIYYSEWLIEQLERHDPRSGLSNNNIGSLIMFVEEINHALHAALQFKAGLRRIDSEDFGVGRARIFGRLSTWCPPVTGAVASHFAIVEQLHKI